MKLEKAVEISDAKISFVSLVDKAANKRQFLITKADDFQVMGGTRLSKSNEATFISQGKILKVDDTTHYITGIVYEPLVEDTQGNFMTEDEIRKAAHWFTKNGDKVDIQHSFEAVDGVTVVESYITPCDMVIADAPIIKGTWIMTVEVTNADVWEKVQKGEISGYSMGGVGHYSEIDVDISKSQESEEKEGLIKKFVGLFGYDIVKKGEVQEKYNQSVKLSNFWDALYVLEDVLRKYNWEKDEYDFITDEAAIKEALAEFSDIIQNLLLTPNITKSLKKEFINKNETEATDMTKNEIQTLIDESIKKALEAKPADSAAALAPDNTPAESITTEAIQKMIADAIKKADEPEDEPLTLESIKKMITEAVEPILKARGLPSNLNGENPVEKSDGEHYLAGIF